MRELGSGIAYNTHNTTSLLRTLKYVSDILQTEEAFTVEEYKHTHTHTQASKSTKLEQLKQPIKGGMDGDLLHIIHSNASSMADKKDTLNWCLKASSLYFFSSSLISWGSSLISLSHVPP